MMPTPEETQKAVEQEAAKQEAAKKSDTETKTEDTETKPEDDIDAKLEKLYEKLDEEQKKNTTPNVVHSDVSTTQSREINTIDDYKKWKEEDPSAAEAWMVKTVTQATIATEDAKKQRKADADTWIKNERAVLSRHADSIKSDGEIDKSHAWMKAYLQVGKENPQLLTIPNGPLLAEAMADKLVNSGNVDKDIEQARADGAKEEADRQAAVANGRTISSTTTRPKQDQVVLSPIEQKMAARYSMTPEEWKRYGSEKTISKINVRTTK